MTKANPTNADLAENLNGLHDCLEDHIANTASQFAGINGKLDVLVANQGAMMGGLGVHQVHANAAPVPTKKKPIVMMTPWQIGWRALGTMGMALPVFFFAVKILNAAWPNIAGFFSAINDLIVRQ